MPQVPLPSERALRGEQLKAVPGGAAHDAEAILRGSQSRSEYDPERWYGAAYNNHDHTVTVRLNIHPDVAQGMNRALYGGQLSAHGIDTPNKFFRAALVDALHKLAMQSGDPRVAALAEAETASAHLDALSEWMARDAARIEKFEAVASHALGEGDWLRLMDAVESAEAIALVLEEPYLSRLQKSIDYYATRLPH
jgi:hypothetical protein